MKTVLLAGMKHCGKSTLGRLLAQETGLGFYDLDDLLCAQDPMARGLSPREIYRTLGKETFQAWETKAAGLFATSNEPRILALGGGTIENPRALDLLSPIGIKVYIKEAPALLYSRIMAGGIPAFLDAADPWGSFLKLFTTRTAALGSWADLTVDLEGADIPKALAILKHNLKEYNHGWQHLR